VNVQVTVDFTGKERPGGYIVSITPEGGNVVGSYGGSGNIDAKNQIAFTDVPPQADTPSWGSRIRRRATRRPSRSRST